MVKVAVSACFLLINFAIITDGSEESRAKKRARAPVLNEPLDPPEQTLEERKGPLNQPNVPPGFLSPSVQQYLELGKSIPGRPGTDYPVLGVVPYTDFYCDEQEYPGFFADVDTRCQAWHYCDIDGRQASFLCPNGTQFSQAFFICDWWFNVRCDLSKELYKINARLYQRPKVNPTRPHRVVTKEVLDNIFLKR
uniref:Chitin-binding type-2 domain-containing protein n=2 Tax=Lygus hesperus TaxID=30085 RepID=A0A0K8TE52_LYGHE